MILVALGSNRAGPWGPPEATVRRAIATLNSGGLRLKRASRLIVSSPFGVTGQAPFVNAVAEIATELRPASLMLEAAPHRTHGWAPPHFALGAAHSGSRPARLSWHGAAQAQPAGTAASRHRRTHLCSGAAGRNRPALAPPGNATRRPRRCCGGLILKARAPCFKPGLTALGQYWPVEWRVLELRRGRYAYAFAWSCAGLVLASSCLGRSGPGGEGQSSRPRPSRSLAAWTMTPASKPASYESRTCRIRCAAVPCIQTACCRRVRSWSSTGKRRLYYILPDGQAIEYKVGVGREGFTWTGANTVSRKAEWPDWRPPPEMIAA